ncbi:peptide ABC transporter substrate-binding protein [Opitutus terrae]|uniref:Extracellular solute-binding protein family 5 n=1 Tax=Opitutus terrae (strain DSM 11246 / JCM 15787 / PB90-1) TaxID=452637 RepID=B1ZSB8_OPITP|nr:peptide ABC transporter substrate-binding protein [Opitutus terrae]ACB75717.1 extracellular solute-binding protein family 5 [Opitutus terrae PB90-1]
MNVHSCRLWLTLAALVLALTGCGKREGAPVQAADGSGGSAKPAPKILLYGNGAEVQDIDPQIVTGLPEHMVVTALGEGLVSYDARDLHPVPGVAESWEISAEGLTYTFHLRADARWANGDPVTARDFVGSYQRILTPALAAEYAYMLYNYIVGAKDYYDGKLTDFSQVGFRALDDRTLEIRLLQPTPYLLNAMNHYAWFPVHLATVAKFDGLARRGTNWTRPENFVGNGAFVIKSWRPNQAFVVQRSPTYWDRARVKLDEIHFFPVDNLDTEERMFRTGQLHVTYEVPSAKIDVYRRENPAALRIAPYLGTYFYRFNVTRPPLNDVRVRRALALAIDRESLVNNVVRGDERPAYAVSYPGNQGYTPRARLQGTVEEARRLLAEAGFPEGRGFPPLTLMYNTQQNNRLIAEAIQQMWRRNLGIDIALSNQEWKVYIDAQHTKNFDIQRAGWIADYVDPHVFLDLWETTSGNNDTGWGSAEYDRLLAASLHAKTTEERYEIYQQLDQILVDELPVMPIYYYNRVHLVSPKLINFFPTLLDLHPWKELDLAE